MGKDEESHADMFEALLRNEQARIVDLRLDFEYMPPYLLDKFPALHTLYDGFEDEFEEERPADFPEVCKTEFELFQLGKVYPKSRYLLPILRGQQFLAHLSIHLPRDSLENVTQGIYIFSLFSLLFSHFRAFCFRIKSAGSRRKKLWNPRSGVFISRKEE